MRGMWARLVLVAILLGCGDDEGVVTCPMGPGPVPIGMACRGSLVCDYGSEICCGQIFPSLQCVCEGGRFECSNTHACLVDAACPDGGH
jgi:hypothetical protein